MQVTKASSSQRIFWVKPVRGPDWAVPLEPVSPVHPAANAANPAPKRRGPNEKRGDELYGKVGFW
jgi:hypothetical protein